MRDEAKLSQWFLAEAAHPTPNYRKGRYFYRPYSQNYSLRISNSEELVKTGEITWIYCPIINDMKVLIVEDDIRIALPLKEELEYRNYLVQLSHRLVGRQF